MKKIFGNKIIHYIIYKHGSSILISRIKIYFIVSKSQCNFSLENIFHFSVIMKNCKF